MGDLDYVGKRILRKDGPEKVTGKAIYSVDIQLRGKLVGRILRSPHAHARMKPSTLSKWNMNRCPRFLTLKKPC